jgi:hypothetical protein
MAPPIQRLVTPIVAATVQLNPAGERPEYENIPAAGE